MRRQPLLSGQCLVEQGKQSNCVDAVAILKEFHNVSSRALLDWQYSHRTQDGQRPVQRKCVATLAAELLPWGIGRATRRAGRGEALSTVMAELVQGSLTTRQFVQGMRSRPRAGKVAESAAAVPSGAP